MVLALILAGISLCGVFMQGYAYRKQSLNGIIVGIALTVPGYWSHPLKEIVNASIDNLVIAVGIYAILWSAGYGSACIFKRGN